MKNTRKTSFSDIDLDLAGDNESAAGSLLGCSGAQLTVDLEKEGKQHGHLKIAILSHTRSPAQLQIPVCVIKGSEPGPVITLLAGLHGDEYEGTLVLQKLSRELKHKEVCGCLILLPNINPDAMKKGLRENPSDGLNLDFAFPGSVNGSDSERLAFEITRHFIGPSDLIVDLRSGGRHLRFIPSAAVRFDLQGRPQSGSENAMIAFGAPNSLRLPASRLNSCLQGTASAMQKDYVQTELGGGMTYGVQILAMAEAGCRNILRHRGMLKDDLQLAATRLLEVRDNSYYVYASASGLFEPLVYLGENVWQEEPMARLVSVTDTSCEPLAVHASRNATLIASHPGGFVNEGELIAILAEEVQG